MREQRRQRVRETSNLSAGDPGGIEEKKEKEDTGQIFIFFSLSP